VRRVYFILLLALLLAASADVGFPDKGRDPPDPPAVPTIIDGEFSKATPENRLPASPEDKPEQHLPGKIR